MPRKRKAKKRRISSRKRRRRTPRCPRPRPRPPPKPNSASSDEDFKVSQEEEEEEEEEIEENVVDDDDDEEGVDDDDDEEEGVDDDDDDDEYDLNSVARCLNPRPKRQQNGHRNRVSSRLDSQKDLDEEFDVDLQRALENDFLDRERTKNQFSCPRNVALCASSSSSSFRTTLGIAQNNEEEKEENHVGDDDEKRKQKGKRKIFQDENARSDAKKHCGMRVDDENTKVCGVCLIEESKIERGMLDCCDHFFCFGCIMEWAKVESRCPMCKQRFVTITKPGGSGKRKRTVRIPLRNQVYVPSDEQDIPLEDPYADIVCMECHDVGDEGLLLLCDRCDAAAHTFCVGLGMSVPLGDWFCRACQALIKENSDNENEEEELVLAPDADGNNEGQSDENEEDEEEEEEAEAEEDSILRSIVASPESSRRRQVRKVRETLVSSCTHSRPRSSNMMQRRRRVRSQSRRRIQRRLLGRRRERDPAVLLSQAVRAISSSHASISSSQIGSARTVPQQRRLQERIHFIRSNWGQIETGNSVVADITMQTIDPSPMVISGMNPMEVERNNATPYADPGESSLQSKLELKQGLQTTGYERNFIVERNPKTPLDPCEGVVPFSSYRRINSDVVALSPSNPSRDANLDFVGESDEMDRDKASLRNSQDRMSHDLPCYEQSNGKHKPELHKLYKCSETSDIDKSYASKTALVDAEKHVYTSRARKNGVGDVGSSSQDGLKVHLTEIVKKQIWPWYLAEELGKEQFKQIARAAVHTLLALCHLGSEGLSCRHLDADQGNSPIANCCGKCFNSHVEKAVKSAKDKVIPS